MNAYTQDITAEIDPRELRDVLGCFATGVAVVTTVGDAGAPVGMTINSFSSVSLTPPLVLWSIGHNAPSYGAFSTHKGFAINILCENSKDLCMNFATPSDDKFAGVDWHEGHNDVPVLDRALATLECDTETRIRSGDHDIFIGRVRNITQADSQPLLFHRGKFAGLGTAL